jgi:hypothetical protein
MKHFYDIVNFNADASCLSTKQWDSAIAGGTQAIFYRWLSLYIKYKKKVSLGLTGATTVDLLRANPESIRLINDNPDIFSIIHRPFAHDISTLRSRRGFLYNITLGQRVLECAFKTVNVFYLPPEFMLTGEQVYLLAEHGITHTFISAERFPEFQRSRIPVDPYTLKGIFHSKLICLPVNGALTQAYLSCMQRYEAKIWQAALVLNDRDNIFFWRDGESFLLVPNGIEREEYWLKICMQDQQRDFLHTVPDPCEEPPASQLDFCPMTPFAPWMKEFRMLGFLSRVAELEHFVLSKPNFSIQMLWLHLISSDILAAVEKSFPNVVLASREGKAPEPFTIIRAPKGLDAEEGMFLLDEYRLKSNHPSDIIDIYPNTDFKKKVFSRFNTLQDFGINHHAI